MSVIDDIKQRLDIVELVSEYVNLQKSGRNFKAICPFHTEKLPSFFVFPERQSWHCFGACGTGGDVFSFIMKKEGIEFGEALHILAEKAGVTLVNTSNPQKETEDKQKDRLFQINEAAAEYYHHLLLNTSAGKTARDYVAQRGLSSQTIEIFQLGFSPDSWEALRQYLMAKGYDETELITVGLLIERADRGNYDRFRNRLMFPIRDIQGHVVGFGARALDETLPKYLNSPQTLTFDKSNSLYGIDRAKTAIRKDNLAIITEGYMDVITAHQHDWENVVAFMGTAITEKQLATLKKLTRNVILALDADTAGEEAISRSGEMSDKMLSVPLEDYLLMEYDYASMLYDNSNQFEVKVFVLPQGKDLDDVIKEDPSQREKLLTNAKPMVDFILETTIKKVDLGNANDKSLAADKVMPLISEIKDPIRRGHYIQRLAQLLNIKESDIRDRLSQSQAIKRKRSTNKKLQSPTPTVSVFTSSKTVEEYCLALLLQYPELKPESTKLSPNLFEHSENQELLIRWQQNTDLDSLRNNLDTTLNEHLSNLLTKFLPPTLKDNVVEQHHVFNDCAARLQEKLLRNMESKKEQLLATEAESGGVEGQLAKLEEQGIEISQQLKSIFTRQGHQGQSITGRNE